MSMYDQLLQEVEAPAQEEEEPEISKCGVEEQNQETHEEDKESKSELVLEKYMKIVLEKRKNQQAQVSFCHICLKLSKTV